LAPAATASDARGGSCARRVAIHPEAQTASVAPTAIVIQVFDIFVAAPLARGIRIIERAPRVVLRRVHRLYSHRLQHAALLSEGVEPMMWRHRDITMAIAIGVSLILSSAAVRSQRPAVRTLTQQEMLDMMQGSSIQASRSSNTEPMLKAVLDAFAHGKTFTMVSLRDVGDDWHLAVPVGVGGGGAWEYVRERTTEQKLPTIPDASVRAIQALQTHIGAKFDALIRFEGAAATLQTFQAASALGIPVVDACPVGRSVPELQMQLTFVAGLPLAPAAAVTRWGDVMILDKAVDGYRVEDLFRAAAVASGGGVSAVQNPMSGKDARRAVIDGSVSQAILYGKTLREARAQKRDPVAALLAAAHGFKLFQGVVIEADMKGDRGFTWWDVEITGTKAYAGHRYRLYLKNENIVGWLDGVPDAMSPDLIVNLDPETGDTLFGQGLGAYPMGRDVVMVGIPNSAMWRTAKGLEVMGPRHFGFDFDYRSLEEIQKTRPTFRP
jgi:DUF917 family protein